MLDRFNFRAWDKEIKRYWEPGNFELRRACKDKSLIIEQCSGLKDKNGILIYEGDIVRFKSDFGKEEFFAEIKFGKAEGYECFYPKWHGKYIEETKYNPGWRKDIHYWIEHQIEVVGNIHENKGLLEE